MTFSSPSAVELTRKQKINLVSGDYPRPATVKCEFKSRTVHQVWLGNSTAECWFEKPVDTVQFRAEPPRSGSGLAGSRRVPWEHEIGSSNLPSPTRFRRLLAARRE